MRHNCSHFADEYFESGLVNGAKNKKNLSEETHQKLKAVEEVEKYENCSKTNRRFHQKYNN